MERPSAEVFDKVLLAWKNCTVGSRDQYILTARGRELGTSMGQISRTVEEVPTPQDDQMDASPYFL